jgi:hypothetical protein
MAREIYTGDKMGKLFIVLLLGINLVFASDFWEKDGIKEILCIIYLIKIKID